jgi:plasmid stabilization system protein ParE
MDEGKRLGLILTDSSLLRFKQEIFPYLETYFHPNRVVKIVDELFEKVNSLIVMPSRGALEKSLTREGREVRFLIYKSGDQFELKIIFFIDQLENKVVVTDFFPTKMNPLKMQSRS